MKYRDHRGALSESMKTVIEINNIVDLISHLNQQYREHGGEIIDVKFEYCGYDERTKWDTYYVLTKLENDNNYFVAGMCNNKM